MLRPQQKRKVLLKDVGFKLFRLGQMLLDIIVSIFITPKFCLLLKKYRGFFRCNNDPQSQEKSMKTVVESIASQGHR